MKTILVDAWNTLVTNKGINEDLYQLLEDFEENKIIVTNANEEEKVKFRIMDMPYPVFSLYHNPNKTDPEYFTKLLKHFSLKSNEVIYFEHNAEAVSSAKSLNIITHHYKTDEPLNILNQFLNKNL
jgi:FMN phosphatase YigB (HAD superfamily)